VLLLQVLNDAGLDGLAKIAQQRKLSPVILYLSVPVCFIICKTNVRGMLLNNQDTYTNPMHLPIDYSTTFSGAGSGMAGRVAETETWHAAIPPL